MMGVVPQYFCGLISRGKRETFPEVDTELEVAAVVHSVESELCTVQLWLYCIDVHGLSYAPSSYDCIVLIQLKFSFPQLCSPGLETWGLISILGQVLHFFSALLQSIVWERAQAAKRPAQCPRVKACLLSSLSDQLLSFQLNIQNDPSLGQRRMQGFKSHL